MTHEYERQCWNCGGQDLEHDDRGVRCRKCGATWNEVPQLTGPTTVPGNVLIPTASGSTKVRAQHPSPGVARQAARARAKASQSPGPK